MINLMAQVNDELWIQHFKLFCKKNNLTVNNGIEIILKDFFNIEKFKGEK